jgi:hypothetical protein
MEYATEYTAQFGDFKPEDLIGKQVLFVFGFTYSGQYSRKIAPIVSVTKTAFKIKGEEGRLFNINTGYQKGLDRKLDRGVHASCVLLTDEEATQLSNQWKNEREIKQLRQEVKNLIDTLSREQLQQIKAIIQL